MYTQIKRFVATLLLFSMLLQSCGNPNCKMVEPADAGSSGKTSKPKGLTPLQPINQQEDAYEGAMQGGSAPKITRSSEASAAVARESFYAPSRTIHGGGRSGTLAPTAARSLVVPASKTAQAARPTSVLKKPPTYEASKPQRAVPDKAPASPHALHSNQLVGATPPPTSVKPSDRTTPLSRPLQRAVRPSQTATTSSVAAHQTPSHAAPKTQLYPSAQGHQVGFQEEKGVWQAQVTNVWGCTQKLPVVCAPDQAPEQAIQQLASKAPGQHKYRIHILKTHQPPWAPRVVYVGALGVLGGMPPKKHAGCTYAYSKWKTHSDGSRTCPSGRHHEAPKRSQSHAHQGSSSYARPQSSSSSNRSNGQSERERQQKQEDKRERQREWERECAERKREREASYRAEMERLNIMFAQARAAEERDWIRFHSQEKYVEHLSDSILLSKKRLHNYKTAVDEENKRLSNIAAQLEQLSQEKEIKYVQLSALDDSLEEARVSLLHFAQLIKVVGTEIQSTIDYANNVDGDMFKKYERLLKGNCMKRNSIFMKDYYEVYKRERINAGDWDSTWANDYGWDNFVHQMLTIRIDWKIFFEVRNKHFEEVFEKLLEASKNQQDALDECSNIRAKVEERSRQELARRAEEALKEKEEIARMLLSRAIASWEALERSSRAQLDKDGEAIASGRSLLSELHTLHGLGTSHLDSSLRQPLVDLISLLTTTIPSYQRRHEEMEAQLKQTFAYKPQTSGKSLAYLEEHHMLLEDSIEEQRERLATYANENSFFRALQENVAPFSLPTHPTTLQAARGACVVHGIHEAIEERARMAQLAGNLEEQRDVVKNAYSKVEGDTSGIINGSINLFAPAFLGPSWVTKKRNRILEAELMWQKEADILGESEDELNLLAQDLDEKDETRKLQIESITTNSAWLHTPVLQELHRPLSPNEVLVSLEKAIRDEEETRSFSWGNLFKPLGSLGKNREERQSFLLSRVFQLQAFEKTSFLEQKAVIESGPLGDVIAALAERSIVRHQHNIRQLLSLEARVKGLPDMVHPSPEGSRPSVGRNEVPSDASLLPLCSLQLNAIRVPSTTELYLSSLVFEGEEVPSKPSETDAASQARQEEEAEEDRKMPSLPRVTTFTSPAAAQEAVEAYLERWNLETPAGRAALQEQGQEILKGVEALKKETASYPLVWDRVLEEQETTSVQLNRLTDLRVQLLHALLHTLPLQTTVHPTQRDDAASVQEDEDNSVEEVYTEYSAMPSNPSTSASASPSVARAQEEQEAEEPLPTPWQGVPFVQPEAPDLAAMLQRNLQLNEPATGDQVEEEDRKMPAKPTASAKQEVSSTDTSSNIQQPRSGAAVSRGFVLNSEGKLQPHEVCVPFAAPGAYKEFRGAKPHPATQDAREQGMAQSMLQSITAYREACEADTEFQQQRSTLSQLEERLKSVTNNEVLSRQYQEQEATFQQHPLYQQGCALAKEAQKLREDESTKADHIILSKSEMQLGMGREKLKERAQHQEKAAAIRDELLQPVRKMLARPSTPPRTRRTGQFAKGVGESVVETAKLPVNLLVLSAKLLGGAASSLATWEDKLGIGEKITDASELISAFGQELKYEWENPEEYRERQKAAQACRLELERAEKALNAEAYHNKEDRELGYWSGEALQAVFGAEVVKGGVKLAKGGVKAAKAAKASKKVAQGTEATKGVARAAKVDQVAQHAKGVESTAKAAERMERTASVEQIIQGASPQVQEAYASAKAWLGEDYRVLVNEKGDTVLMSKDGLRKLRTDFYDKKYSPHVHLEEFRKGKWRDAIAGKHHIHPKGD